MPLRAPRLLDDVLLRRGPSSRRAETDHDSTSSLLAAGLSSHPAEPSSYSRRETLERMSSCAAVTASGLFVPTTTAAAAATNEAKIPTTTLGSSSLQISKTIQGYWQLAGGHGRYKESDAIENMVAHYKSGITTLDTADIYGPSELIVGKFVKQYKDAVPCTKVCLCLYMYMR